MITVVSFLDNIYNKTEDQKHRINCFIKSCEKNNIKPIIIQFSKNYYKGSITKLIAYKNFLIKNKTKLKYLLFVDCMDSLFLKNPEEILNFDEKDQTILFGAEKACYPDGGLACKYPSSNYSSQYLNSGMIFGEVDNLIKFFDKINLFNKNPVFKDSFHNTENSQYLLTLAFLNQIEKIKIDDKCMYFQNMFNTKIHDFIFEEPRLILNKETKTHPFLFHFNGTIKYLPLYDNFCNFILK
jgi:hypothetical protein